MPERVSWCTSVRLLACSTVMAMIFPVASRSRIVFSSRSLVSTTLSSLNSIYKVSVNHQNNSFSWLKSESVKEYIVDRFSVFKKDNT